MSELSISPSELEKFALVYEAGPEKPVRSVVLDFQGLGYVSMPSEPPDIALSCANNGALYLRPYYGPWSWMNDTAVKYVDTVVRAAFLRYGLERNTPVISSGSSMGGLSALVYTKYARITPAACAANCPVCDLPFHYTERKDLPRTLYCAFGHYDMPLEDAMKTASPIHLAAGMPDIPYYIVHGNADTLVNKQKHSDVFVREMKKYGKNITYDEVSGMEHCDLKGEALERYRDFIFRVRK